MTILKLLTRCGARMPLTGAEYRRVASRGALLAFVRARRERLAAQPAVPEDVKFRKTQETRQRKPSKRLKRQEPERKEKHRERQGRANRKQHHKLSKPSTRHDMQRQRRVTKAKLSYRLNLTDTALLPARSNGASGGN